ncbi:uncharacterized protein [Lolium perenne]|uniref:uncharacterized protein n=1 Tax=Lolium perenne TaxID=4522 RepID=UPI0021F5CEA7|nr:uncharacterized protein LOC127306008 [Lolium perenne]
MYCTLQVCSCLLGEDVLSVYVYEIQLESTSQGNGLGKFLMQLIEPRKCQMRSMMLTVQKPNTEAMAFYNKLRYAISYLTITSGSADQDWYKL